MSATALDIKPDSLTAAQQRAILRYAFPDVWATDMSLAVDGGPFAIEGREYERAIIRDESPHIVIPKGAQLGLTTVMIVRTCHWVTQRGWKHLYLLPLKTGAVSFVQGRIDPVIASNKKLADLFDRTDNTTHKQSSGGVNLYIRGTNIWTELREIPVDVLVMDERDKMVEKHIPEAVARLDGSKIQRITELSTPTAPGHGVDDEESWGDSDQHRWWVPCTHCSRPQVLTFEHNIEPWLSDRARDCKAYCQFCKKVFTEADRYEMNALGHWEPDNIGGNKRGYHISQLASPTKTVPQFVDNYFKGQKDSLFMRAFYNNNRGEPYVAEGDQFTPDLLDSCRDSELKLGGIPQSALYIGVDVGNVLHVTTNTVSRRGALCAYGFNIFAGVGDQKWAKLRSFLDGLSASWIAVIDAHPEKSKVEELSLDYPGRVWMGFEKDNPGQPETAVWSANKFGEVCRVNIDRTMAFDTLIAKAMSGSYRLPANARDIGEHMPNLAYNGFYYQMIQQARELEQNDKGVVMARWVKTKRPDHWHHSGMFAMTATMRDTPLLVTEEVRTLFANSGSILNA